MNSRGGAPFKCVRPLSGCIFQASNGSVSVNPEALVSEGDTVDFEALELMEAITIDRHIKPSHTLE